MYIVPISSMITPLESITEKQGVQKSAGGSQAGSMFSDFLKNAVNDLKETQAASSKDSYDLAMGNTDDLAQIAIHSLQASTAVEMTTQLTTRVVNAYKEVMQMQV